ncbi:CxxH/CxxC protein [Desertibacillus haloalkaliphilus]|uniref:CxxH/CxxC protein n=1 Tax=Desertibacillus haloalkaliphilus TaxID=1328930 RepID=UPI001FEC4E5A|nr:CxxH/CxxC protein [Desertibacillus haloalkaliphilus]
MCCVEHVEIAIDEVVDEYHTAPVVEKLTEESVLSTSCSFCSKQALYRISE